ncbi:MAG TPA: hypothetical protein VN495_04100 [Candidatus Paceibacterota bacterium]|nr:hypothetical protein [Candidatus Paceibacterota bacterium]
MLPPHAREQQADPRFSWQKIPHYWGDPVRALLICAAVLSLLFVPALGNLLPFGSTFEVGFAIVLVLCAALTHPHSKMTLIADTIVSGLGAFLVEEAAITLFSPDQLVLFVIREAVAIFLLFAFYFSLKTVRAMTLHTIGHRETFGEFVEPGDMADDEPVSRG